MVDGVPGEAIAFWGMANEFADRLLHGHEVDLSIGWWDGKEITVAWAVSGSVDFAIVSDFLDNLYFVAFSVDEGFACDRLKNTFALMRDFDFDFHEAAFLGFGGIGSQ